MKSIEAFVANALGIPTARITDDLAYQSIVEWDSFAHVQMMLALEQKLDVEITNELMIELDSIRAIKAYASRLKSSAAAAAPARDTANVDRHHRAVEIHRGLSGIHFDHSSITFIDGEAGRLEYRGYEVNALAEGASFEEAVWLLLCGELPTARDLAQIRRDLARARVLPQQVLTIIEALKSAHPMVALRTVVSALATYESGGGEADAATGIRLIGQVPAVIAAHHALRNGRVPLQPDPARSHADDFLRMLLGHEPQPELSRLVDQDLIVHADHSSNASAFAARVAISAGADPHAAITAALATFAGPLHGGAVEAVLHQIDRIGGPERAAAFVRDLQSQNQPVMGFGHRVYRTEDPRVRHFRATAQAMSRRHGDTRDFETVEALVAAMKPFARLGIGPNVDLYAGLVYRLMRLPDDLATAIFAAGRMPGWIAQALEQKSNNILIRPLLQYAGKPSRPFVPLAERANWPDTVIAA